MTWGEFLGIAGVAAAGAVGTALFARYAGPHLARFLTKVEKVPGFAARRPYRLGLFRLTVGLVGAGLLCLIMVGRLSTDDHHPVGNGDLWPPLLTAAAFLVVGLALGRLWWVRAGSDAEADVTADG